MENKDFDQLQRSVECYQLMQSEENLLDIISASEGLIYHFARLYGGGSSLDDLYQVGCEGLLKSLNTYDADRGTKFVTYASHNIIGEIRHFVRKERHYYYPGYLEKYQEKAYDYISEQLDQDDTLISSEQLADRLNLKPESVPQVMAAGLVHLNHLELSQIKAKAYETFTLPVEDKLLISQLLYRLSDIQKDVIEMLYYRGMTQQETAEELGMSQRQVSRINEKSLKQMHKEMKLSKR
jgi:RNA polymerase sigma-B factor